MLALGLSWLVTAATDEGSVAWGERAGRTLPLAPLCAAVGAWAALAPVMARGETVALGALGRSRAQIAAAAVGGGALVALAAAAAVGVLRGVDVTGFFPTATHASAWSWSGTGFVDPLHGFRVGADGTPTRIAAVAGRGITGIPAFGRAAASLMTAMAGLALPLLLAHTMLARARALPVILVAGLAVVSSVVIFQAAAAGRLPAALGVLPALVLLGVAVRRYRGANA